LTRARGWHRLQGPTDDCGRFPLPWLALEGRREGHGRYTLGWLCRSTGAARRTKHQYCWSGHQFIASAKPHSSQAFWPANMICSSPTHPYAIQFCELICPSAKSHAKLLLFCFHPSAMQWPCATCWPHQTHLRHSKIPSLQSQNQGAVRGMMWPQVHLRAGELRASVFEVLSALQVMRPRMATGFAVQLHCIMCAFYCRACVSAATISARPSNLSCYSHDEHGGL
jgi:hypothetical protein